ncbi:MAG: hypothetical protein AB7G17_00785 [Phycisphaerales bacterium]
MLHRHSPFRFVLTLLLALVVPFCCCNFRSLLTACVSCEAATAAQPVAIDYANEAEHGHAIHGHSPGGNDHHGPTTPGNAPEHDEHDCQCDKSVGTMLTDAKLAVELPASMLVAVLDWTSTTDLCSLAPFKGRDIEKRAVERPQTSLLRMHCALIV